jgi:S-adenosylmethionine:tRNA ribosyltransferase-isomerase
VAASAPYAEPAVKVDELDYELPPELIAQHPAEPRDAARLLVCRRSGAGSPAVLEDRRFADLPSVLRPGDLLVRNDTRVLAARTFFRRPTGGRLEVLFLQAASVRAPARDSESVSRAQTAAALQRHDSEPGGAAPVAPEAVASPHQAPASRPEAAPETWEVLVRGRPRVGETLALDADCEWQLEVLDELGEGRWLVASGSPQPVTLLLDQHGCAPLPPYIRAPLDDPQRYQTIFACRPGSAAAPTAGLHFTQGLDAGLAAAGIEIVELTLHVGLGTFKPLATEVLEDTRLHSEAFELPVRAWERLRQAPAEGRRVVAVGTTMVRLLEHLAAAAPRPDPDGVLRGRTSLLIAPGHRFRVVDALITNFHLPRTSLLALVMAFAGVQQTRAAYDHAVAGGYRFYSFGDAMLVT